MEMTPEDAAEAAHEAAKLLADPLYVVVSTVTGPDGKDIEPGTVLGLYGLDPDSDEYAEVIRHLRPYVPGEDQAT